MFVCFTMLRYILETELAHTHLYIFSAHTPSQYSLALATDGWQFMLYSMNTEFSEKILTAMKKHWLTKQLEQNKKRGCEEGKTQISNSKWKESEKQTWPKKLTSGLLLIPSMC